VHPYPALDGQALTSEEWPHSAETGGQQALRALPDVASASEAALVDKPLGKCEPAGGWALVEPVDQEVLPCCQEVLPYGFRWEWKDRRHIPMVVAVLATAAG